MTSNHVERAIQALFPSRLFVLLLVGGLIAGGVGYGSFATVVEELYPRDRTGPMWSYGQQAGCVAMPSCIFMAGAVGYALALTTLRQFTLATVLLLAVATCMAAFTLHLWNHSLRTYGPDFSDAILYHPPLGFATITLLAALCIALFGVVQTAKRLLFSTVASPL